MGLKSLEGGRGWKGAYLSRFETFCFGLAAFVVETFNFLLEDFVLCVPVAVLVASVLLVWGAGFGAGAELGELLEEGGAFGVPAFAFVEETGGGVGREVGGTVLAGVAAGTAAAAVVCVELCVEVFDGVVVLLLHGGSCSMGLGELVCKSLDLSPLLRKLSPLHNPLLINRILLLLQFINQFVDRLLLGLAFGAVRAVQCCGVELCCAELVR